jgi:hypothetical protein
LAVSSAPEGLGCMISGWGRVTVSSTILGSRVPIMVGSSSVSQFGLVLAPTRADLGPD